MPGQDEKATSSNEIHDPMRSLFDDESMKTGNTLTIRQPLSASHTKYHDVNARGIRKVSLYIVVKRQLAVVAAGGK
jgi:hypothetical protein